MREQWTIVIKPKKALFDINWKEVWQYKDLIKLFVKKNFMVQYKQTILGPAWFIINPLITTFIYNFIFGTIAGLSTGGVPAFAFYLCSNTLWQYFSTCLTQTSDTFIANSGIFGKVYFPRLTVPLSTVIFFLVHFGVMFVMTIVTLVIYGFMGENIEINWTAMFIPVYILQAAILSMGVGIICASLTTKYKDLRVLISFGVQLWMYATPVVYTLDTVPKAFKTIILCNPLTPLMNNFRYSLLGCGSFQSVWWILSLVVTILVFVAGVVLFQHIERTFMDTV